MTDEPYEFKVIDDAHKQRFLEGKLRNAEHRILELRFELDHGELEDELPVGPDGERPNRLTLKESKERDVQQAEEEAREIWSELQAMKGNQGDTDGE